MDKPISIQLLDNRFSAQVVDLVLPIQQIEFNVPITVDMQPDLLDIDRYYLAPGGGFWGAFSNDLLLGTIGLIHIGNGAGAIRKMFVRKEYRGRQWRIAQALFDQLRSFSQDHLLTDLYLGTVESMTAAHRFYERNGFVRMAPGLLPSSFPRMKPDTVFYHLQLTQS